MRRRWPTSSPALAAYQVQRALDHLVEVAAEDPVVDDLADRERDRQVEDHLPEQRRLREQEPAPSRRIEPDRGQQRPEIRRPQGR
jgi:hypothetical protein